jgi:hypothetical protein
MNPTSFCSSAQFQLRLFIAFCIVGTCAAEASAQGTDEPAQKPTPPKIEKQFMVFPESVVLEQWPHTLKLVNAPQDMKLLNPGQCIRVGVFASGDDRDDYLARTQLSFHVDFAGQAQDHPMAPLAAFKQIKPEGGDLVTAALGAADIKNPFLTMASMGASAANWCVPADAQEGKVTIDAEVDTPSGRQKLERTRIQIESFDAAANRPIKDEQELNDFEMSYHWQPNPGRLFPYLQFYSADTQIQTQTGSLETAATFLSYALKGDPVAAKDFMARVSGQTGFAHAFGLLVLLDAGYDIEPVLKTLTEEGRQRFSKHPVLPDPFDLTHVEDIGTRLDMLWSEFMASGQFAPVQKIASALTWHGDWEDLDKARKSANPPHEWTPAIGRAVGYGAAGWALGSFQRNDPLAADYIEQLIPVPDTPDVEKAELKVLLTDPAFKMQGEK